MKLNNYSYLIVLILFSGCTILNPELRYKLRGSSKYYFPSLSDKIKQKETECLELEQFPCAFKQNDTLNDFTNKWYSKHLESMKEPILYNQIGKGKKVVRFSNLGTWSSPYSYRIENKNGQIIGIYSITNGRGGYEAGRRIKYEEKILAKSNWDILSKKIDSIFWEIQTHDTLAILDGEQWILEVLINNKYHVVSRTSPNNYGDKEYSLLCKKVVEIFSSK